MAVLRRRSAARLAASADAGIRASADLDARMLVGHALGLGPGELVLHDADAVAPEVERAVEGFVTNRAAGMPVARITGIKEFWSLPFRLSAETLVPRPDTETLVAAALAAIDAAGRRDDALTILDLGTGSGAILLALLSELPAATGVGVDISEGAVRTARRNARDLGLALRASFVVGDWASAIGGRFDLVVSNPPYIAGEEIAGLPVAVRNHDPHIALDGGRDGVAIYPQLFDVMQALLPPRGIALVEIGSGQAGTVAEMARRRGYVVHSHRDIAGIERVIELNRTSAKIGLEIGLEAANVRSP
ncbi:MAG: peptide chain release factor N(5)-glutamine methyltransferase [Bauldia sp.]|nr:peptide chain release factor N(5)-glutamine methyltransferase [Bauldia sp.]